MADIREKDGNQVLLDQGQVAFQAEGRLLQELGERLVASPEVALVELIKNAYDADSSSCEVRISDDRKTLVITDTGHGMRFDEFVGKWMRIATGSKAEERFSRKYKRRLTGAKGIGRFAVRYLGDHLSLITIATDPIRKKKTKLTAIFDWPKIDRLSDIRDAEVAYKLEQVSAETETGTTLEIRSLKTSTEFTGQKSLRSSVLRIVTPLQGLDAGRFKGASQGSETDPGFRVILPGDAGEEREEIDLAELVLKNYWARLQINLTGKNLTFNVWFSNSKIPKTLKLTVSTTISAGLVADIRYFPRRGGVFRGKAFNGKTAWEWVRQNHGVAVVDRGFRIVPYGYEFDDWLHLSIDKAHSERNWRSLIAQKEFPIPESIRNRPALNPALYLPYDYQLVGAVFVESKPPGVSKRIQDLVPSMDREGFLKNKAFEELTEFIRAGIEFLAYQDKRELDRILNKEAREASQSLRKDLQSAITYIKQSPTLTAPDKSRISKAYSHLAARIEEVEEYNVKARQSLTTMSLLGVVAGFMTHENRSLVHEMEKSVNTIHALSKKHPSLAETAIELDKRLKTFKEQLQYAQMFIEGVRSNASVKMSAAGQIRYILKRFESFANDHGIEVSYDAPTDVHTPALSPPVYTGILLNLYTNALKAVLAVSSSIKNPKIAIRVWNEKGIHSLEVCDTGVGIPPGLEKRIWDPLYTTTSDSGNPLGSGMGLGLTLIKQVVEETGGKIKLVSEPPPGFKTCFRVDFPLEIKHAN
jgi:signal transduction histidine kinase